MDFSAECAWIFRLHVPPGVCGMMIRGQLPDLPTVVLVISMVVSIVMGVSQ